MSNHCRDCIFFEPLKDNRLYSRPFDGHCVLSMDLVFEDDECDEDDEVPPGVLTTLKSNID